MIFPALARPSPHPTIAARGSRRQENHPDTFSLLTFSLLSRTPLGSFGFGPRRAPRGADHGTTLGGMVKRDWTMGLFGNFHQVAPVR
ncbi:MAG: hypothetical protein V2A79_10450, partial [Planctomycetota bacterium]